MGKMDKLLDSIVGISVELEPSIADFATNDFIHEFVESQTEYFVDTKFQTAIASAAAIHQHQFVTEPVVADWEAFAEVVGGVVGNQVIVEGLDASGVLNTLYFAELAACPDIQGLYHVGLTLPNGTFVEVDIIALPVHGNVNQFETVAFHNNSVNSSNTLTMHNYYNG
mmetsp:Transcript_39098/g.37402  ORF Transcript_39098/g.37402 Transcript_39098/m.37402 type:complete len:168 (+) Transcript_39098:3353-3856(+)